MEEVNINHALEKIRSATVKGRSEGIADLEHILSQNRRSQKFEVLADKSFHKILEALFRVTTTECSAYAKASKSVAKNQAKSQASQIAGRLSACASVVRIAVELGVKKFRYKTVKAIVDHITQTVPTSDRGYCEPLAAEYFKSLRIVLEYQPHPEHLSKDEWHEVVDFCNETLHDLNATSTGKHAHSLNGSSSMDSFNICLSRSATPGTVSDNGRQASNLSAQHLVKLNLKSSVEDIVLCLKHLMLASNAPVLEKAQTTLENLCDLLTLSSRPGVLLQSVFEAINSIISRIMTDNVDLTLHIIGNLLPHIRRFWETKSRSLKDHMLVSLLYGEVYFFRLVSMDETGDCKSDLHRLLQVFRQEYCKRPEREQLQLEDLDLPDHPLEADRPLSIQAFELRSAALKAEQPWFLLYICASIVLVFSAWDAARGRFLEHSTLEHPPKRRKLNSPVDDLLELTKTSDMLDRLFALQVLTFVFDKIVVDIDNLQHCIESLLSCLSDDTANVVSWALLALARYSILRSSCGFNSADIMISAAGREISQYSGIRGLWLQVWRLAARHIASSTTCRPSCQLMTVLLNFELVRYDEIADIVDNVLASVELNGPADCVDSACSLWSILVLLRGRENLGSVFESSESILRWICNRWSPAKFSGRDHALNHPQNRAAYHVFRLISVCLGLKHPPPCHRQAFKLGLLSQGHLRCLNEKKLIEYLTLKDTLPIWSTKEMRTSILRAWEINLSNLQFQNLSAVILDLLLAESANILRDNFALDLSESFKICRDIIFHASSLSLIGYAMLAHPNIQDTRKGKDLTVVVGKLKNAILETILHQPQKRDLIYGVYDTLEPFVGKLNNILSKETLLSRGVITMARDFDEEFWGDFRTAYIQFSADEENAMNLDDDFESQEGFGRTEKVAAEISHDVIAAATDTMAFRNGVASRICFLSNLDMTAKYDKIAESWDAASFIRYLTSLKPHEFLACRPFLREMFQSNARIDSEEGSLLLKYLGQKILYPYELERCDVSLCVCLDIMTGMAEMWTRAENVEIFEIGGSLYEWFINIALNRGISSPEVHKNISSMLQRVIKVRPEYARSRNESLPSARTSLFQVLQEGNIRVKFHVGQNVSEIFGLFVLKEHDSILEDVIDNLPSTVDWEEGISLRLFVLAHLAASWPTLLRRCVYALFETAGNAHGCTRHAKYCLTLISHSLGLENLHKLFQLFVSQIVYTWLETQPLETIPFTIFGYDSLSELLRDIQDEVIGQIVMRGKDDESAQLAKDLGKPYEDLLAASFGKVAAYSIARDVAIPPSQHSQASGADVRLRKILGKDRYASLVTKFFPSILATLYKTLDEVELVERGFQKRPTYAKTYGAYRKMISNSSSETVLPLNQQPSFKARYLIDEVEYLCRRTSYEADTIWSPDLYVYVFRELLNTIHPALGSLHACSVLRRIRVLVAMAGSVALEYYPIEMALHALRPYITNTICAEDAIGMVQYLISSGMEYLKDVPSFLVGLAVSTMTSLKSFLGSTQESTTQESQFQATMSKAQAFHGWLAATLDQYKSPHISGKQEQSFKALVRAAQNLQDNGNSRKGTYESELLLEILEDQRSNRNILSQSSQNLILSLLCNTFEVPSSFRDDIFGSDDQAALFAPILWRTCQRSNYGQSYLLWVGRVLGRAYAGTGLMDPEMASETNLDFEQRPTSITPVVPNSAGSILRLLCNIILAEDPAEVGMAEMILRAIVTKADGTEYYPICEQTLPNSLMKGMLWRHYPCPNDAPEMAQGGTTLEKVALEDRKPASQWIQELCTALAQVTKDDPILLKLPHILTKMTRFAEQAFPYVLHLVLEKEFDGQRLTKQTMSLAYSEWFIKSDPATIPHMKILLKAILYLRRQPLPHETTKADRSRWLDIDYRLAAQAAVRCSMFKTALLFVDISYSEVAKASRRSSAIKIEEPTDLLLRIFENVDEQDAFYGVQQPSSLSSMMARLEYENAGFKSLSFRGAHYDSRIRLSKDTNWEDEGSIVKILDSLDLHGLSQSLLSKMSNSGPDSIDSMLQTARKLEQWDISAPVSHVSCTSTVFRVFQSINNTADFRALSVAIDSGIQESMKTLMTRNIANSSLQTTLSTLSILAEAEEVLSSQDTGQLAEAWARFESRDKWMSSASFKNISNIISCRETLFSSLSKKRTLQGFLKTSQRDARGFESRSLLASSKMSRRHGALQNALATATYLTQLIKPCEDAGINIAAAVKLESANILWAQGEMAASIRMLQELYQSFDAKSQFIHVGKSELLAKLGHQIAEARLEKPDEIINRYLAPAIKDLYGMVQGDEAGQVFHEFASFCDQQLQNQDSLEDFQRIQRLRERKEAEVRDLERMIKSSSSQAKDKDNLKSHHAKAKLWFDLDNREFQRLRDSRQAFLRQSLENYLLCLGASDKYDNDALRFSALWLENWESEIANGAVSKHVAKVGSRKFAPLMNQWSSRLLDVDCAFQSLLSSLILRICVDHPYHGMYQIFAGSKTKGGKDETALARHAAAQKIVNQLKANTRSSATWVALHNTNISFVRFAADRMDESKIKSGAKVALRKSVTGTRLEQDIQNQKVPPPTMKITLRANCDYSDVPLIAKFQPEYTVASGNSMPKIVTAIGTDGLKYKQLFKGGNDDLRQDSIMEQVFEQVSNLLQAQQATRQRNLGIRTYKVLPLTATAGIIEFVTNTVPLHDYLMPAHQRHFPNDFKPTNCRKHIADAQGKSVDQRIKTFRQVIDHFHPVLRYFFMERFENPDDWFDKRLAYTRSTAAISILGHVLGLGDRHGHNILLDEKTGEVVHIDLGIAFEQGRVLPVPEVVPFRLTRDVVDGMGITGTEGVFRRCCEFTLEALRNESYSIMTILDVLRYDPLYSWSVSPLRLKKMQDAQNEPVGGGGSGDGAAGDGVGKLTRKDEPGEADRALTVVAKKLSKSLSVTATVNELIQQAMDEKNLAVLFCGWASYA